MIGQRVESQPTFPWEAASLFAVALGLVAISAATGTPHSAVAAILPVAIGAALLFNRPARFAAELAEEGLQISDPPHLIPYSAIEGLTVAGKPTRARSPLYIFHAAGVVAVPPRLNVPTRELYGFLASRLSESGSRNVPASLQKYLQQQTETFGDAEVLSFRARPHLTPVARKRKVAACLAGVGAAVAWVAIGFLAGREFIHWIIIGGLMAVIFGMAALAYGLHRQRASHIQDWQKSGLVLGPGGLALVQGDIRGEMRWQDLGNVEYWPVAPSSFLASAPGVRGIILAVPGARIVIADIYDRPLPLIYDRIRSYWQGREANA
jgi:hypothetical protein